MHRLARVLGGLALVLAAGPALASFTPIQLDGEFADWDGLAPLLTDASGDGGTVDFARIWVTNDQDYLYIRFETGGEVQPDEQQDMLLIGCLNESDLEKRAVREVKRPFRYLIHHLPQPGFPLG